METETMRLMPEADWTVVRNVVQKTITMTGAKFTGDDTDYLVAFHLLHEAEMLDLFGAIKSAYELGRRSQGDLLEAAQKAAQHLQGHCDAILESNDIPAFDEINAILQSLRAAIAKAEKGKA